MLEADASFLAIDPVYFLDIFLVRLHGRKDVVKKNKLSCSSLTNSSVTFAHCEASLLAQSLAIWLINENSREIEKVRDFGKRGRSRI